MDSLASRYANALFSIALEENKVAAYQEQVISIDSILHEHKEFNDILNHFKVEEKDKKEMIDTVFKKDFDLTIVNFLKLLIDKRRFNHFKAICSEFNSLANEYQGVKEGVIYSAKALDEAMMKNIEDSVAKKLGNRVELKNIIDESLIGGFKVMVGDTVFDSSIKSKLNSLKYELLDGKR